MPAILFIYHENDIFLLYFKEQIWYNNTNLEIASST